MMRPQEEARATFGEKVLEALRKTVSLDSYLKKEQQEDLKKVDTKEEMEAFLKKNSISGVDIERNARHTAASIASALKFHRLVGNIGCEGCFLAPITFQANWLIDEYRQGRLRFSMAEFLAFGLLVAICLSYEFGIAFPLVGMPYQLMFALPASLLIGAVYSFVTKKPRWIIIAIDVIVIMEVIAFIAWKRL